MGEEINGPAILFKGRATKRGRQIGEVQEISTLSNDDKENLHSKRRLLQEIYRRKEIR